VTVAVVAPAVPLNVTSVPVKPLTVSLKTAVKLIVEPFVGSAWPTAWLIVTVGWTVSIVNVFAELDPVLAAVSDCYACAVYWTSGSVDAKTEYALPLLLVVSVWTSGPDVFAPL
jgi:hypothetical protein